MISNTAKENFSLLYEAADEIERLQASVKALYDDEQYMECQRLRAALEKLLSVPGDHMSACDRIMGDTHPCTCGADDARKLLA